MIFSRRHFIRTAGYRSHAIFPFLGYGRTEDLLPNKKLVMMYLPNGILDGTFPGEEDATLPALRRWIQCGQDEGSKKTP